MTETTTAEIAKILGVSERRIRNRSIMEGWPYHKIRDYGDKTKRKYFQIKDLPADIRNQVIQAQESFYLKNIIAPQREDFDVSIVKELIRRWDRAPKWKKSNAEARLDISKALEKFCRGRDLTSGRQEFRNRYNVHNNELGVSESTFQRFREIKSLATLYNWDCRYKEEGLVGLLDEDKAKPRSVFTPEMEKYVTALLARNPDIRAVRVQEYLLNKFGVNLSGRTVREKVRKIRNQQKQAFAQLNDPDRWRNEYQVAFGNAAESARYFLHQVELDTTPGDIELKGKQRRKLITGVDRFCRKAKVLVSPVSKSESIAALIRIIGIEWGLPTEIICDRGKDYMSHHVEIVCGALGIKRNPTPGYTPEAKPFVERYFKTLAESFFEEFEEFIGHHVAQGKKIRNRRAFIESLMTEGKVIEINMTEEEFQSKINHWNDYIYHQKVHRGLGKSPEARAAESMMPVRKIKDERVWDLLLPKAGSRVVGKKGIEFNGGLFAAPELWQYVKERVEVRQDLQNAGKLYAFDEKTKAYICTARDTALEPFTAEEATKVRKEQRKQVREEVKALLTLAKSVGDPMSELLEAKRTEPGQIRAFHRVEKAEGGMIKEAEKALEAQIETIEEFTPDSEGQKLINVTQDNPKVIAYPQKAPFFQSCLERYKYLKSQEKINNLTKRDREFMREYEDTLDYYRIFVMPYEEEGAK